MTFSRKLNLAGSVAAMALTLGAGAAMAEKSVTIGLTADAVHFDPQAGEELSSNIMFYHVYDPLVRRDAELQFGPGLAESWELKDDVTWHFTLREGVQFHDGDMLKASDVVFTLDRLKGSLMANLAANIESFSAIDDRTVEIKTLRPYAALPNDLAAILILSEDHVKKVGEDALDQNPMGTGPYVLKEWVREDHITLEAFDDYYMGEAEIETVTFRPITNPATRTAALLTGEVDVVQDLAVRDVERVKSEDGFEVITRPSLLNLVLALDLREESPTIEGKNPMTDRRVREAMARAIDVDTISKVVMNGLSTPSDQYVPASHVGHKDGMSFRDLYPYDLQKAQALMEEAGVKEFTLTLDATNNRYVNDAQIAQALASMLAKIGVNVELNLMPKSNFFGHIRVPTPNSSFIMSGWDVPSGDAGSMYGVMFYSRDKKEGYGQVNRGSYSNPEVDALIDQADSTPRVEERDAHLQKVTEILLQDIPMIPVHYEQDIYAARDGVTFTPRTDKFLWAYTMDVAE